MFKEFLSALPNLPGVYRMINQADEVIYVGKARDLKKRVSSYFQKTDLGPRIQLMVSQISRIETTVTRSESEALLLENNLIKTLAPRYNVLFRDDKSYPYITLSGHDFPRLGFHRGTLDKKNRYFGPFPNAGAVRESIQLLQKIFQIRTCEDHVFNNRSRPCLLHQIKRCSAPCVNLIQSERYQQDINTAMMFLQGKESEVIATLNRQMEAAAEAMRYEEAAMVRDKIQTIRKVQEKQFVSRDNNLDVDVIAGVEEQGIICVNVVMIRGGRHLGDKSFFPRNAGAFGLEEVLAAFLSQHYLQRSAPPLIILGQIIDVEALSAVLEEQSGGKTRISFTATGDRRVWLQMATENAKLAVGQKLSQRSTQEDRLHALHQALNLPVTVQRIECFDISHTMGEATVASCVVYDRCAMQNSEYRRFNITGITPGDDFAAMRDVLTRRYQRLAAGEGKTPDLILIDGGRGQVNIAAEVLAETGLSDIYLIGVAKGVERKAGMEQLIFPDEQKSVQLPKDHPALHLIQQIRDEAHRFAISGHRAKRGKARTHSTLQEIGGIGAKRRQVLLAHFGGLKGVLSASVDDLAQVDGISRTLAEKIYQELH